MYEGWLAALQLGGCCHVRMSLTSRVCSTPVPPCCGCAVSLCWWLNMLHVQGPHALPVTHSCDCWLQGVPMGASKSHATGCLPGFFCVLFQVQLQWVQAREEVACVDVLPAARVTKLCDSVSSAMQGGSGFMDAAELLAAPMLPAQACCRCCTVLGVCANCAGIPAREQGVVSGGRRREGSLGGGG